ncbi:MAG: Fe-S cluster assembly ATPase SufC [bacterium]
MLRIKDLYVEVEGREILKQINLEIEKGKIYAVMGPNGTGKSTLAYTIAGHPRYKVNKGNILFKGKDITNLSPTERARLGIFLAFQYPIGIPGVTVASFLKTIINIRKGENISLSKFNRLLKEKMSILEIEEDFARRYLNDGFSGGEKKKCEILQMALLEPDLAILDEIDSGLDVDALKVVAESIKRIFNSNMSIIIITHYSRILDYIEPNFVYVMKNGQIVASGGRELANFIEENGYEWLEGVDLNVR